MYLLHDTNNNDDLHDGVRVRIGYVYLQFHGNMRE